MACYYSNKKATNTGTKTALSSKHVQVKLFFFKFFVFPVHGMGNDCFSRLTLFRFLSGTWSLSSCFQIEIICVKRTQSIEWFSEAILFAPVQLVCKSSVSSDGKMIMWWCQILWWASISPFIFRFFFMQCILIIFPFLQLLPNSPSLPYQHNCISSLKIKKKNNKNQK